jgi:hypothetical protein
MSGGTQRRCNRTLTPRADLGGRDPVERAERVEVREPEAHAEEVAQPVPQTRCRRSDEPYLV